MQQFKAFRLDEVDKKIRAGFVDMKLEDLDPGEVVVRVAYSDVNYKDALAATGKGRILLRPSCIGGIDLAGTVTESSDPRFAKGDAVLAVGHELGVKHHGGYAEYARIPADWAVKLPKGMSLWEAMAFGTASVPKCDKLFGPGNAWVTEAKRQVAADPYGAAIDLPAGPSEVLVIADAQANAEAIAADLLAQAEHGPDSQVIVIADDRTVLDATLDELRRQLPQLARAGVAARALAHARVVLADSIDEALAISNAYAPEHLILNVAAPRRWLEQVENAGSVFLGPWSPESVGDYCSGTNHVLPTYGHARSSSGVSVASFVKQVTVQELSADGLRAIGPCAATLARAEGLDAHERAVSRRLAWRGAPA